MIKVNYTPVGDKFINDNVLDYLINKHGLTDDFGYVTFNEVDDLLCFVEDVMKSIGDKDEDE